MVIAWMFAASTGILFARYYKYFLPNVKWFKVQFWFNAHRSLMFSVPVLSIISFLIILSELDWKWISLESRETNQKFAHSIFGIVAIGLSFFQVKLSCLSLFLQIRYLTILN
jgi:hypothetical protein